MTCEPEVAPLVIYAMQGVLCVVGLGIALVALLVRKGGSSGPPWRVPDEPPFRNPVSEDEQ